MIVRREDDPLLTNLASSPLPTLCAHLVVLWSVLNVEFHTVNFYRHSIFGLFTSTWKFELTMKVWKKTQSYALRETESFYDSMIGLKLYNWVTIVCTSTNRFSSWTILSLSKPLISFMNNTRIRIQRSVRRIATLRHRHLPYFALPCFTLLHFSLPYSILLRSPFL